MGRGPERLELKQKAATPTSLGRAASSQPAISATTEDIRVLGSAPIFSKV